MELAEGRNVPPFAFGSRFLSESPPEERTKRE